MRSRMSEEELKMLTQDHELMAYSDLTEDDSKKHIVYALDNSVVNKDKNVSPCSNLNSTM